MSARGLQARGAAGETQGVSWLHLGGAALFFIWMMSLAMPDRPGSFLHGIDLAFHEAGHLFLAPFGRTLHLLGGTLLQLIVPAALCCYFIVRRSPFSAAFCVFWLGENLIDVSVYMADARTLQLDLVGGGEHDWNNLFYQFGMLTEGRVAAISTTTHHLGVLVMLAATVWVGLLGLRPDRKTALTDWLCERIPFLRAYVD